MSGINKDTVAGYADVDMDNDVVDSYNKAKDSHDDNSVTETYTEANDTMDSYNKSKDLSLIHI